MNSCENKIVEILNEFKINGSCSITTTDKAYDHSYEQVYGVHLLPYLDNAGSLLEIGVYGGGSAVLWNNLLPKFNLCLLDITEVMDHSNRIRLDFNKTNYIINDAYQESVRDNIKNLYPDKFDIIIDDGPHTVESQVRCIELYLSLLKDDGVLIIEDVQSIENAQIIQAAIPITHNYQVADLRNVKSRYDDIAVIIKKNKMNKKTKIVMMSMFKNEAHTIGRMLESCYRYIDYYILQDNGSTDGTPEVVANFFKDKNIPGFVYNVEEGWVGFGWNRDHLLQKLLSTDHGCDWILKMDCDEILSVDESFDWSVFDDTSIQSFHVTAQLNSTIYHRAWMWNARLPWRFNHDTAHETISLEIDGIGENFNRVNLPNTFKQIGFNDGQSWGVRTKYITDSLILEEKLIRENTMLEDTYHFWYIGKSYADCYANDFYPLGKNHSKELARRCIFYFDEYVNFRHNYRQTNKPTTLDEMSYFAMMLIGDAYKFLENYNLAEQYYANAEAFAPGRNEHLVQLARLYNHLAEYQFMYNVTSKLMLPERVNPFPNYILFIDTNSYHDTGSYINELHNIAMNNLPIKSQPVINTITNSDFDINNTADKRIFIVDNFYKNPDKVREFALTTNFNEDPDWYKGSRSSQQHIFPGTREAFEKIMGVKITNFEEHGQCGKFQICTSKEDIVYHHDSQKWAALVYLTPDAPFETGTCLLSSKITGARNVNDPNSDASFSGGFYDKTKFEVVDVVGNVYNRLVIFDAQCIHAASQYFGIDKFNSRLTHLFFFD